jgi:methylenetetrahydrofolate reductase (NADPH)
MAHLSCVGETIEGLETILARLTEAGIENVLALRGDPPRGEPDFTPPPGGLRGSPELASFIRERGEWGIGCSCFPEVHPEASSREADIAYLREKVDGGAQFLITQFFFENEVFFEWLAEVRAAGIDVPIIPGVFPVLTRAGLHRFCKLCKARIPEGFDRQLETLGGDADAERQFGIAYATRQCEELLAAGAPGIHFFTINRHTSTRAILGALRAARPWERAPDAELGATPAQAR